MATGHTQYSFFRPTTLYIIARARILRLRRHDVVVVVAFLVNVVAIAREPARAYGVRTHAPGQCVRDVAYASATD